MRTVAKILLIAIGAAVVALASTGPDCAEPLRLTWVFGEVDAGSPIQVARRMQADVLTILSGYPYAGYERTSTNLPTGATFDLIAPIGIGTLTGTLQHPGEIILVYAFVDQAGCPLVELTIRIDTVGSGSGEVGTGSVEACMEILAIHREPGFLFLPATTTAANPVIAVAAQPVVGPPELKHAPFDLCGSAGDLYTLNAAAVIRDEANEVVPFVQWERKAGGDWEPYSTNYEISVAVNEQHSYRAVFENSATAQASSNVCLTVRAGYGANPLPVSLIVNGTQEKTALFELCVPAGTLQTVRAPDTFESGGNRFNFLYWEHYNKIVQKWERFADTNEVAVTVLEKGQIRAVYGAPSSTQAANQSDVCLTVRAGYGANPVPAPLITNSTEERTTPFELCVAQGTTVTIFASDVFVSDGDRFEFRYWERYSKAEKKWQRFAEKNHVTVTVVEKGQIRAVYDYTPPRQSGTSPSSGDDCRTVTAHLIGDGLPSVQEQSTDDGVAVGMTIDGTEVKTTPFESCCPKGTRHTVEAPETIRVDGSTYRFQRWEEYVDAEGSSGWYAFQTSPLYEVLACMRDRRAIYERDDSAESGG